MGGSRCTYRNCSVKSDGKTHMFHYPVFDKVRCHHWLVNAQRLDFLHLKVSQLKNRCICQHHFSTENFMNYKKDKLTFDAVPTLDGPYCDPTKFIRAGDHQEYPLPILVEDIENDFDINDKKSNFSVKYGDFLTNNEFADSSARYNRNKISLKKEFSDLNTITSSHNKNKEKDLPDPQNKKVSMPAKKVKTLLPQPIKVPPYSDLSNELRMGKELNLEQNVIDLNSNLNQPKKYTLPESTTEVAVPPIQADNVADPVIVKIQPKVNILSEEKIIGLTDIAHINITGKFEKVSPSKPLILPDKRIMSGKDVTKEPEIKPQIYLDKDIKETDITPHLLMLKPPNTMSELSELNNLNVQFDPETPKIQKVQQDESKSTRDEVSQSPPKRSVQVKNKITPERSAAIEKKRKFNLKLKDIIESCLDKLDDPGKNYETSPNLPEKLEKPIDKISKINEPLKTNQTKTPVDNVSLIKKENGVPAVHDSTLAYLEMRIKQMENTLLDKIAQNSQEIIAFKKTWAKEPVVAKRKEKSNKRCVSTQTNENVTTHKKFLYQEISKYLSPSANSLLYEELFINKYQVKSPRRKRRKCI